MKLMVQDGSLSLISLVELYLFWFWSMKEPEMEVSLAALSIPPLRVPGLPLETHEKRGRGGQPTAGLETRR